LVEESIKNLKEIVAKGDETGNEGKFDLYL
jgi:hypothetical protein